MAVEGDVGVGEVVDEHELALARQVDEALHQLGSRDRRRGVVRERDDHDSWSGLRGADGLLDPREQVVVLEPRVDDGRACEPRRDEMDRVARARDDRAVAALEQHPHQMGQPLLRADRRDDVHVGIELDAELRAVPLADRLAQVGKPAARRVAVVHRLGGGLGELLDRDRRARGCRGCRSRGRSRRDPRAEARASAGRPSRRRRGGDRGFAEIASSPERGVRPCLLRSCAAASARASTQPSRTVSAPAASGRWNRSTTGRRSRASSPGSGSRPGRSPCGATPTSCPRFRPTTPIAAPGSRRSSPHRGSPPRSGSARSSSSSTSRTRPTRSRTGSSRSRPRRRRSSGSTRSRRPPRGTSRTRSRRGRPRWGSGR